jgi:plastocyanin
MRRVIMTLVAFVALASPFVALSAFAQDDTQVAQVNIVEPPFQSPQQWNYDPNDVTVSVGTTVTWTNTGAVAHTVTSDDGASFDSGSLDPQAAFSFTPDTPGTFTYHCTFHPWMTGALTVTS